MNVKRPELIERYGYDVKYASHIVRLGFQGIDYLSYGWLVLPLPQEQRLAIQAIRNGEWSKAEVLARAEEMEREIKRLLDKSPLTEKPEFDAVSKWLARTYGDYYHEKGWLL
jgi:hypothetical protein